MYLYLLICFSIDLFHLTFATCISIEGFELGAFFHWYQLFIMTGSDVNFIKTFFGWYISGLNLQPWLELITCIILPLTFELKMLDEQVLV